MNRKQLRDMGLTDEATITSVLNALEGETEDLKEQHRAALEKAMSKPAPKPVEKPTEPKPAGTKPTKGSEEGAAAPGVEQDELAQLRRELEAERQKNQDRERKDVILGALAAHNPRNPALLYAALDQSKLEIKDGKLTGLDEQIAPLKKSDGYLFKDAPGTKGGFSGTHQQQADSGVGNGEINAAIRGAAGYVD